jgi:hypothetical protein
MSIIADRGLFVRLLVQSGRFDTPGAESFADAVDAATREPATKDDVTTLRNEIAALRTDLKADDTGVRAELKAAVQLLYQRLDALEKRLDARFDSQADKLIVRLGALGLALAGLLFAALRLT